MKSIMLRWFAIVLILEVGLLHIMNAQGEYEEAAYMGYLFAANFFGALIAAYGIYHKQFWGWALGLIIAAGSIAGYVWSRTRGMPGMNMEEWFSPYGIVALSAEGLFMLLAPARPWKNLADESARAANPRLRYILPVAGLFAIVALSGFTYQWDAAMIQAFGYHVGTLDQIRSTPAMTFGQLEEQYGVQVSLVANSMMGSIVDVRLKIDDPDKAHALLQNQAALLLNQEALVIAPHMHSHGGGRLRAGTQFIIFFPAGQIIHPGSNVSLVFGSVRVEPVVVQ
jgi:hypothetical protein